MATALPYPVTDTKTAGKTNTWLLRFFPSLTDIAFLLPLWFLFSGATNINALLGDGDTGWHIRAGDWMLQHGQVPHQDLFSFTKAGQPWFAWEWGWDVLASLVHKQWGLPGIVLVNAAIVALMSAFLFRLVRRHTVNHFIALGITILAAVATSFHWLARPHLLAWVFVLVFLDVIDRYERAPGKQLWLLPPVMLFWTNLHGSFFVGIVFLLTYALVEGVQYFLTAGETNLKKPVSYLLCALACGVVTFANPYGWHLHQHLLGYLTDSKQLNAINEYASIDFHDPSNRFYEAFLFVGLGAATHCFWRGRWPQAISVLLWTHLSLCIVRNVPIFLFVTAPVVARFIDDMLWAASGPENMTWVRLTALKIKTLGHDFANFEMATRVPVIPTLGVFAVATLVGVIPTQSSRAVTFDTKNFPAAAIPVIERYSDARVFTHDQWGDYLIYRLYPHYQVFVDGRSDLYGMAFSKGWIDAINGHYTWREELSRYSINTVLARPADPLASLLKLAPGWSVVFDDGRAIVFRHRDQRVSAGVLSGRKNL